LDARQILVPGPDFFTRSPQQLQIKEKLLDTVFLQYIL
jgi:hypothetical protein